MIKKKILLLIMLLVFSVTCVGQNKLVKLDTKEMGINKDDFDVEIEEIERKENISRLKITDKTLVSVCNVITLEMQVIYKIAKLRNCKYFIMLEEQDLGEDSYISTVGFTNKKHVDIKAEFGSNYSDKYEDGEKRFISPIRGIEFVFGIPHSSSSKNIPKKRTR